MVFKYISCARMMRLGCSQVPRRHSIPSWLSAERKHVQTLAEGADSGAVQGARFAGARQIGTTGSCVRAALTGSCARRITAKAAMAPPSELSWGSLGDALRERHPDIIASHENATAEVRDLTSELIHVMGSFGCGLHFASCADGVHPWLTA